MQNGRADSGGSTGWVSARISRAKNQSEVNYGFVACLPEPCRSSLRPTGALPELASLGPAYEGPAGARSVGPVVGIVAC
ncbi:MAG: hypothetical protein Fues2KO_17950 [Fuerstiella sp.]